MSGGYVSKTKEIEQAVDLGDRGTVSHEPSPFRRPKRPAAAFAPCRVAQDRTPISVAARNEVGRRPNGVCVWDTRGPSSASAAEVGKHKINRLSSKQILKRSSD
jgi:hypothetical protein